MPSTPSTSRKRSTSRKATSTPSQPTSRKRSTSRSVSRKSSSASNKSVTRSAAAATSDPITPLEAVRGIVQHAAIALLIGFLYLIPAVLAQQYIHHLPLSDVAGAMKYVQVRELVTLGLVFCAGFTVILAYLALYDPDLFRRRLQFIGAGEQRSQQRFILRMSGVGALFLGVGAAVERQTQWSGQVSPLVIAAGNIVAAIAFFIIFLTFKCNTYASSTIEVTKGQKVIDTSVYSLTRHPMYTAGCLLMFAAPLALAAPTTLIVSPLLCYTFVVRLQDEEEMLERELQGYKAYKKRVQYRLVPYVY